MSGRIQSVPAYDYLLKLMIIGDSAVGKTCLLLRFADDAFSETFIATIGIDFKVKTLEIEGKRIKLQIWDTAGQERFQTLTASYYRGAMGIIVVYDITQEKTLENVDRWMHNIVEHSNKDVILFLVGSKADLEDQRVVPYSEGEKMAMKYKIPYYEASAKTNYNVEKIFNDIAKKIFAKQLELEQKNNAQPKQTSILSSLNSRKNGSVNGDGCC